MAAALKTPKITLAAALVNMQGSLNHLTDILKHQLVNEKPEGKIAEALDLLSNTDRDLPIDERSFLMMKIGQDSIVATIYAGTSDRELQHKYVHDLYAQSAACDATSVASSLFVTDFSVVDDMVDIDSNMS